MIFPRQKLYDLNFFGLFKCLIFNNLNKLNKNEKEIEIIKKLKKKFFILFGYRNLIPLSMGRMGCYFAVKYCVTEKKKKILICPFTIFDMINMIKLGGGIPVFIDSKKYSPHPTYEEIKSNITSDTAAIILTNYHNTNSEHKKIYKLCKLKKIKIIEDNAISIGNKRNSFYPDFAIFSFGLFKFISSFNGGGIYVKSKKISLQIENEINKWQHISRLDLFPVFLKGMKFKILTQIKIFNYFTFPIFKFGFLNNINFIKQMAKNDPNPFLRKKFSNNMKKKLSIFQLKEIIRQIPRVKKNRKVRLKNTNIFINKLKKNLKQNITRSIRYKYDCFLNFPLLIDKDNFYNDLMRNNIDASKYYYRNCASINFFKKYARKRLINLERYVDKIIILPTYPSLSKKYINTIIKYINSSKLIN